MEWKRKARLRNLSQAYLVPRSHYTHLQWIVDTHGKGSVHRLPKLWLVASHINVPNNRLRRRENVVARCPQSSAHDDLLSHEDPRQERIKWDFLQKGRVSDKVASSRERCKAGCVQFDMIVLAVAFQADNL